MKTNKTLRFKYKLPVSSALLMVMLTIGLTLFSGFVAYTNPDFRITRLLTKLFSPDAPSIFFWVLTILSGLSSLFVLWFVFRTQKAGGFIELGESSLFVPKANIAMSYFAIPYDSINDVATITLSGQRMLFIKSTVGESRLSSKWFATAEEFAEFHQELLQRKKISNSNNLIEKQKALGTDAVLAPHEEIFMNAIKEKSKEDPLISAKIGAKEVYQRLLEGMKTEKGVQIESILCALGSLAGYSCQASLRAQAMEKGIPVNSIFVIMNTTNGKQYYFGDPLNSYLIGNEHSIWALAAGAAQHNGCKEFPDINEIAEYNVQVLGSDKFGILRVPENHKPQDIPINYVTSLWPALLPTVKLFCQKHSEWPILFGLAIQEAIYAGKTIIDPELALKIVMESAFSMSKIDIDNP
jgi:hypothetical protein